MKITRRSFLKFTTFLAGTAFVGKTSKVNALDNTDNKSDYYGVLVDTTYCNGCRKCEWACNEWNKNPNQPVKTFEDKKVFDKIRRTNATTFTVVNRFISQKDSNPIYVKKQCMHCIEPGCVSACFVDAFKKTKSGAVIYNPDLCVGCRYCMIACPFDIPSYEYNDPLTPKVTKCTLCFDRINKDGGIPACVEECTTETLRFGKRNELINIAHERIRNNPGRYVDHVYGENEVGGTSWLYLSSVPFEQIGMRIDLGKKTIPERSKGFLFTVKIFEIIAAWPLVFAAFHAMKKMREK